MKKINKIDIVIILWIIIFLVNNLIRAIALQDTLVSNISRYPLSNFMSPYIYLLPVLIIVIGVIGDSMDKNRLVKKEDENIKR